MAITNRIHDLEMMTCLIVDDDKFSRTFITNALYQIGIKTIKEATMPDKRGMELRQEFRPHPASEVNSIPIIMITVDTKEKTVLDAKNLGIREYLVKPISPIALKKRICNVFGIKERV